MREDDEHKDDRHPFAVVEQPIGQRRHRKALDALLILLYHRINGLPAPRGHLFDVLYGHFSRRLLGVCNSHERHLIRLMLRVRRAVIVPVAAHSLEHEEPDFFGSEIGDMKSATAELSKQNGLEPPKNLNNEH